VLYRVGEALGAAQLMSRATTDEANPVLGPAISADWPPTSFDLANWQQTAMPPPSPQG
jgi:hypothetical protein